MAIKNPNRNYECLVHIESVNCSEGTINRIVINRSKLKKLGFVIIEE